MKAVAMMKRAIKDSDLNGYKWTADKSGLHWEYCETSFTLIVDSEDGIQMVTFKDLVTGESVHTFVVPEEDEWLCGSDHYHHRNVDDAIYWAARKMISKANYVY